MRARVVHRRPSHTYVCLCVSDGFHGFHGRMNCVQLWLGRGGRWGVVVRVREWSY